MNIQTDRLTTLLERINGGQAKEVLPELEALLRQEPGHRALLALWAEAVHKSGTVPEAIAAFKVAGAGGAGARNWLAAGILLAGERNTVEALACLHEAAALEPDNEEVLDTLMSTLFNANRHDEGMELARRQLGLSKNPQFLTNAALLLQKNDQYEEASDAFRNIIEVAAEHPYVIGAALVAARFTCDWDWIETLQRKVLEYYARDQFGAPQEYPLTHTTWCADEAINYGVTRAYAKRMIAAVEPIAPPARASGGRIRVGYMSCDFRNHATMHLMAGLFECHDRERFEVFAYDYTSGELYDYSDYRQRFVDAVEHLVEINSLSDRQAAARIAQDQLDILFDLKGYTGGGRSGIMAYRPAPLQAAYIGYPGSVIADIDYIVSDRFVTPDSSTPYYTEKFCRLPHSYQCNDRKRAIAPAPGARAMHGLPDDKVVFGAFNQCYKIDRASFDVWLRILAQVPNSVLWVLGQSESMIQNLSRHALQAGIELGRLIFAPFAAPQAHLARLQLTDAVLDTLLCNGHTTTSDALWAGVPVLTARGSHFASRVSESLLNAMELPELVGVDRDDMVRIATRIGTDAGYRAALREKVAAKRLTAPLFDTVRFTRNFETGIAMMVEAHRAGRSGAHFDVPDSENTKPMAVAVHDVVAALPEKLAAKRPTVPLLRSISIAVQDIVAGLRGKFADKRLTAPLIGHLDVPKSEDAISKSRAASDVGKVRVVMIRPENSTHHLGLYELSETIIFGLREINVACDVGVNEFDNTGVNIIIGAHLLSRDGLDKIPSGSIIYNSEQMGAPCFRDESVYLAALREHQVWDYSINNVQNLKGKGVGAIQFVPIGYVDQLTRIPVVAEDIDVLFYGSMNERRNKVVNELIALGFNVKSIFDVYGEERDRYIARSKIVLNIHFYDDQVFEIVRVSYLLANQKTVVAECNELTSVEPDIKKSVAAVPYDQLVETCARLLRSEVERKKIANDGFEIFSARRESSFLASALNCADSNHNSFLPSNFNLGSGKDWREDSFNVDINEKFRPDAIVDISSNIFDDKKIQTRRFGDIKLKKSQFRTIIANDVLALIPDLTSAMTNCLQLLVAGGTFQISVPYDLSLGAWQDPTHVRAFNENSWLYYTDWFWYLGWFETRFDLISLSYNLSEFGREMHANNESLHSIIRTPRAVDSMHVVLRKRYLLESEKGASDSMLKRPDKSMTQKHC